MVIQNNRFTKHLGLRQAFWIYSPSALITAMGRLDRLRIACFDPAARAFPSEDRAWGLDCVLLSAGPD